MKPAKFFLAVLFACALSTSAADHAMAAGAGKDKGSHRGGKAAEHMSSKGAANSNAQWSADPEKGWVRAAERHDLHQNKAISDEANQPKGKLKGKGKKF